METQFTYIVDLAKQYSQYIQDSQLVYQALNKLPESELRSISAEYGDPQNSFKPVNLLRAEVARRLLAGESIDESVSEEIKEKIRLKDTSYFAHYPESFLSQLEASNVDKRDVFKTWQKPWSVFHTFFYRGKIKETVVRYQQQIAAQLQHDLQLSDYDVHFVDFQGARNTGSDGAWLALYPRAKQSHRDSYQFFLRFATQSEAGQVVGRNLGTQKEDQRTPVNSYADTLRVLLAHKSDIIRLNETTRDYFKFAPGPQASQWEAFYEQGIAALDYKEYDVGDLSLITSTQELNQKAGLPQNSDSNQTWNMWLFRNARRGDVLFANQGVDTVVGIGIIEEEYFYDASATNYKHKIKVNWFANKVYQYKSGRFKGQKTLFRRDTFSPTKVWNKILADYLDQYPEYQNDYDKYQLLPQSEMLPNSPNGKGSASDGDDLVEDNTEEGDDESNIENNYWWLNASPSVWSISSYNEGDRQTWTTHNEKGNKRRIYRYFEAVQPGDLVIGYESTPVKQVKALIEITKPIHQSETEGEVIEFEILEKYAVPVHWNDLQNNPALGECEVFINNQGSLFKLTEDEFDLIREVVDTKNILVEQQQQIGSSQPYTYVDDPDKPFISGESFQEIVSLLKRKKNIILQGPPGVGKTFIAKKLAYEIMQQRNDANIETIQFHQSYSYEDFIQGIRPVRDGFELKNGVFYTFCQKAHAHPNRQFFFIIDEINRGNLSKIFGELMLLIESDKRNAKWATKFTYAEDEQDRFYIPENVHIIGTMNTADRSLAIVDYALRRRFAFINLEPNFDTPFADFLAAQGVTPKLIAHIQREVAVVNNHIMDDDNLGSGFQIGHSYFCTYRNGMDETRWFNEVLRFEIRPLLEEIWFDNLDRVEQLVNGMSK